jgi:hypothetical protein
MPTPKAGENRGKFVSRCIQYLRHEGDNRPTRQVAGKCFGIYDNSKKKGGKK